MSLTAGARCVRAGTSCCRCCTRSRTGPDGSAAGRSSTHAGGFRSRRPRRTAWSASTRDSRCSRAARWPSTSATTSPVNAPELTICARRWRRTSERRAGPGTAARASDFAIARRRHSWSGRVPITRKGRLRRSRSRARHPFCAAVIGLPRPSPRPYPLGGEGLFCGGWGSSIRSASTAISATAVSRPCGGPRRWADRR